MSIELETVVDSSNEDIGFRAAVATNLREQIHAAGVQATQEIFTEQIVPEAKSLCPVGGKDDPHPGKNRDSIDVSFHDHPDTGYISAWMYTESGYGWLIEHGTSHNRELTKTPKRRRKGQVAKDDRTPSRPYLYPAMRFCSAIADRAREILESL
jgi:hypothetical protein